jgi:hypothetical protein
VCVRGPVGNTLPTGGIPLQLIAKVMEEVGKKVGRMLCAQASHDYCGGVGRSNCRQGHRKRGKRRTNPTCLRARAPSSETKTPSGECHIPWVRCDWSMSSFVTLYRMCGFKDWVWFGAGWLTLQGVWAGSRAHLTHMVARSVVPCTRNSLAAAWDWRRWIFMSM